MRPFSRLSVVTLDPRLLPQDGLHLELLDLRAHVWGVEQDLQKVVKTGEWVWGYGCFGTRKTT
jgi:hypothetical protein